MLTSKVADYTYDSSYRTFTQNPALRKKVENLPIPLPLLFLASHFAYYLVLHCLSVLLYHCYWLNIAACFFWIFISLYHGASFYMEYFARKYESQLAKLEELRTIATTATPPSNVTGSQEAQTKDSKKEQ